MTEFLYLFRRDTEAAQAQHSPEQMQAMMKLWQDWIGGIAAQNKLVSIGNRLAHDGKIVKGSGVVTDGPFVELKEAVGGYTIVKTDTIEDAVALANGCPILQIGGSVEVRAIVPMEM